jgi:16S rRNA (cytosine1402-N4)-methyltransferase
MATVHIPILAEPIIQALIEPFLKLPPDAPPHWIMDCTLGGGGHTGAFLSALASYPQLKSHGVIAVDQDPDAIRRASERFKNEIQQNRLKLIHSRFGDVASVVQDHRVFGLMADLGFSSDQLEDPMRGLSFQHEGPLDMRLDPTQGRTCRELLQQASEIEIESWLREWGEERFSRRIASAIVYRRRQGELPTTTKGLAELVIRAIPAGARHGRIHAATRTFQALRIAVNDELIELEKLLNDVIPGVHPGGRIAILSFHSLEDRRVKIKFKESVDLEPTTKKPIQADDEEIRRNPRSRSAKLRIVEKQPC